MPIYDFKCSCGRVREYIVKNLETEVFCDECGHKLEPMISAPKVFFNLPMGNGNFDKMNSSNRR